MLKKYSEMKIKQTRDHTFIYKISQILIRHEQ